jgi:putative glutamine amidotransferase
LLDHREDKSQPLDVQYAPAHDVELAEGGLLHRLAGKRRLKVNSVHSQGVERLGQGLIEEARASDGVVEAFRVDGAPAFALAVQWHPEWKVMDNPFSRALFAEFGRASRERAARRAR